MNRLSKALCAGLFFGSLEVHEAFSDTVLYQPTPYPSKKSDGSAMPKDLKIVHTHQGWFGSVSNKTLVEDAFLKIGSFKDYTVSVINFDLTGLPSGVDKAGLFLYAGSPETLYPSQMSMFRITSTWNPSTMGWANFPSTKEGYYWSVSSAFNKYRGYNILTWYTPQTQLYETEPRSPMI